MNKLIIYTKHPQAIAGLLKDFQLVEGRLGLGNQIPDGKFDINAPIRLEVDHPDDAISQELAFWFALAEGCGLVSKHRLLQQWEIDQQVELRERNILR